MSPPESRSADWARVPRLMDHLIAFAIGALLAMVIVSGWPPDVGEERVWIAGGVGGLVVVIGLFWASRRRRAKSPGA